MKKVIALLILVLLVVLAVLHFYKTSPKLLSIVAAANVQTALDSIVRDFEKAHPLVEVSVTYGASGKLYEQINNGAPFDIFLSADMELPQKLKEKRLLISEVKLYATGQMVLWSKQFNVEQRGMECLTDANIRKIAIANPAAAPYGKRAIESMKYYKQYNALESKLVYGENITQTSQFVSSGAAQVAFVALSTALSPALQKEGGNYFLIPSSSYHALQQGMVMLKHAEGNANASLFFDFMLGSSAQNILQHNGYLKP
jgi:molybdate transport system substrate-binding protein